MFFLVAIGYFLPARSQVYRNPRVFWAGGISQEKKDYYVAFRGTLDYSGDSPVTLEMSGASWYGIWLNGEYLTEGPSRFALQRPEYSTTVVTLRKGKNLIAIQGHYEGVTTRLQKDMPPFIYCRALSNGTEIGVNWVFSRLNGYDPEVQRINPQLAWMEWCDTRKNPRGWQQQEFDDSDWRPVRKWDGSPGELHPSNVPIPKKFNIVPVKLASGTLAEMYGYEKDNPSARFFLRDLEGRSLPAQGIWVRYDLGRVRLARPKFTLDLPAGAVVEFAYSEMLHHGRVAPWITLSLDDSHNMDHYVARGGPQEFFPLTPKGGRFVEMHILAPPDSIRIIEEIFLERTYHGAAVASFRSSDDLLNKIWSTGIETYRACTEDALTDNPTRERGQWTGDVATVGMMLANTGYGDLRLIRKALVQSALCAREDGMVAGLTPGGEEYLITYSMQWVSACLKYYQLTNDIGLLRELFEYASRNIKVIELYRGEKGIGSKAGWAFIDWGYRSSGEDTDPAVSLHYEMALKDFVKWAAIIGKTSEKEYYTGITSEVEQLNEKILASYRRNGAMQYRELGYHKTVLAGILNRFRPHEKESAVAYIKAHILRCFPNDSSAPRLGGPEQDNERIITPYFAHYSFPFLIENGEMEFVLDQYRKCWGWALGDGRTTWLEVFDIRWSHCHQWAGCPTWQLTRYVLGVSSSFYRNRIAFEIDPVRSSLSFAEGKVPVPGTEGFISARWEKEGDQVIYTVIPPFPVQIKFPGDKKYREIRKETRVRFTPHM